MTGLRWPRSAARCVYCREWEPYGEPSLVEIERRIGIVYAHRGCAVSYQLTPYRVIRYVVPVGAL